MITLTATLWLPFSAVCSDMNPNKPFLPEEGFCQVFRYEKKKYLSII